MHWIGAHFCVCLFLYSRDKSLKMLNLCEQSKRIKEQQKNKRSVQVVESAYNSQNKTEFGFVKACFFLNVV